MDPSKKRRGKPHIRSNHPNCSRDPNRVLNERQEAFAIYFATPEETKDGKLRYRDKSEAYRLAYPIATPESAQKSAARVSRMTAWQNRVAQIREKRFAKLEIDQEWFNREFKKRYEANVADYYKTIEVDKNGNEYELGKAPMHEAEVDANGNQYEAGKVPKGLATETKTVAIPTRIQQVIKRLDELSVDQQLLLEGYSIKRTAKGAIEMDFKLDKKGAIENLARGAGYFKDKVDVTSGGKPIESLTDEERVARIVALAQKVKERQSA